MSSVTFIRGKEWWLSKDTPSGKKVFPERIVVGDPFSGRVYVPVKKANGRYLQADDDYINYLTYFQMGREGVLHLLNDVPKRDESNDEHFCGLVDKYLND